MSSNGERASGREHLPIPDPQYVGVTTYDAKDPDTTFPPIAAAPPARRRAERPHHPDRRRRLRRRRAPSAAHATRRPSSGWPRAASSTHRFHTTALCSPTRAALLSGRNHHSVGMGGITEIATSAPGYSSMRPNNKAPLAETLKLNGYSHRPVRQVPRGPGLGDEPDGPVRPLADAGQRLRALLRLHRRRDEPVRAGALPATRCRSSPTARPRRATTSPRT